MTTNLLTIVVLSNTHGMHGRMKHPVPEGDVLIHSGDFCGRGLYGDAVEEIYWSTGEVLSALARHGLVQNTRVVRRRVAFIARWLGRIPAGSVCHEMAMSPECAQLVA